MCRLRAASDLLWNRPLTPMHPAQLSIGALLAECNVRRTRRGGPGGQHRNKVESGVELTHTPTGVAAEGTERRSQHENHAVAVHRLRVRLAIAVRAEPDNEPTPLWCTRRVGSRVRVSVEHADFPALLAEALDQVEGFEGDVGAAAAKLGVSGTQLVNLMALEPAALEALNRRRAGRGQRPLRA